MTDVVLNTGMVIAEYDGGADLEGQSLVFGASPQWDDGDDDTGAVVRAYRYDVGTHDGFIGKAVAAVIGNADGKGFLSLAVRWLSDAGSHQTALGVGLRVDDTLATFSSLAPTGLVQDGVLVLRPTDATFGYSWDDITTAIGEDRVTVFVQPYDIPATIGTASNAVATVYELVITAIDPIPPSPALAPARRLYPRTDSVGPGLGRIYPPPNTQQSGGRFGSAAPL